MASRKRLASSALVSESDQHDSDRKSFRYAITFGEVAVLHSGGVEVGSGLREEGFSVAELRVLERNLPGAKLIMISDVLPQCDRKENEAAVLHLPKGAATFLGSQDAVEELWKEQCTVEYDKKFFDRGQTKNKRARHNIIFGLEAKTASTDYRQPTVISFHNVPLLSKFRDALVEHLGTKASDLNAEGNHYYNDACGIGFHGDREREIVICLSLGAASILRYQWRRPRSSEPYCAPIDICVGHGDVYVMSEKATGNDWMRRSLLRVVHAAGAAKYLS